MIRLDGLDNLPKNLPRPVVTVGTFDGFHLGHQRVLSEVLSWAKSSGGTSVRAVPACRQAARVSRRELHSAPQ